jgi:hypothetical protein
MDLENKLIEAFKPGCIEPEFGSTDLRRYGKKDTLLPRSEWCRYTLEADLKLNGTNYGQRFKQKYFDTTFNFCLAHDGELIATVGFEIDGDALNIWQIQGVKGQLEWLHPIKWPRALVDYCVHWAAGIGARDAFIVSVDHNAWAARHGHLDPQRGKLLYDVTAKRSGFRRTNDGYYRLALTCR